MGTTGVFWTQASTRWSFGPWVTSHPCVGAMSAWNQIPPSVTSSSPKHPSRGWRRSGPKGGRSRRIFSCVFVLWGSESYGLAPRQSTAAGRVSGWEELGPLKPGKHERRWESGLMNCPLGKFTFLLLKELTWLTKSISQISKHADRFMSLTLFSVWGPFRLWQAHNLLGTILLQNRFLNWFKYP